MKKWLSLALLLIFLLIAGGISYIYSSNPLAIVGSSLTTLESGQAEMVLQLENKGMQSVTLREINIDGRIPEQLSLGISYGTMQDQSSLLRGE